uniref:amiloride-sensitive sodium channel subunit beta-like n=1 Tax=Myxine glutinosa TaxID=7769 RepID=UPI00358E9EF6
MLPQEMWTWFFWSKFSTNSPLNLYYHKLFLYFKKFSMYQPVFGDDKILMLFRVLQENMWLRRYMTRVLHRIQKGPLFTTSELLIWYCQNTNTHGPGRVIAGGPKKRTAWMLITLTVLCVMLWQWYEIAQEYLSYGVTVTVTMGFQKLNFPAVTICNLNPYRFSAINKYIEELDNYTQLVLNGLYTEVGRDEWKFTRGLAKHWDFTPLVWIEKLPNGFRVTDIVSEKCEWQKGTLSQVVQSNMVLQDNCLSQEQPRGSEKVIGFRLCDLSGHECLYKVFNSAVNAIRSWYQLQLLDLLGDLSQADKAKLGYTAKDLIHACIFSGQTCEAKSQARNFSSFFHPIYGNCYTINSGDDPLQVSNPGVEFVADTSLCESESETSVSESAFSSLGLHGSIVQACQALGMVLGSQSHHVTRTESGQQMMHNFQLASFGCGEVDGPGCSGSTSMSLILSIDQHDYVPYLMRSAGALVMLHPQGSYPFLQEGGIYILPGMETSIGIEMEDIELLGPPYSNCTKDGLDLSVPNLYNMTYSFQVCLTSCFQMHMVRECGCGYYLYPLPPGAEYCQKNSHWAYCYDKLFHRLSHENTSCMDACKQPCSDKEYQMTISMADWPSETSEKWIFHILSKEKNTSGGAKINRNNIMKVNLYFEEFNHKTTMESPAQTLITLLSNFGGLFGLWMGGSVLCIIEAAEIIVDLMWIGIIWLAAKMKELRARSQKQPSFSDAPPSIQQLEQQGHVNSVCETETVPGVGDSGGPPPAQTEEVESAQQPIPSTPPPKYEALNVRCPHLLKCDSDRWEEFVDRL